MLKLLGLLAALSFAGITGAEQVNIDPTLVHEAAFRGGGHRGGPGAGGHRGGRGGGPGMGRGNHGGAGIGHIGGNRGHRPNPGVRPGNPGHRPSPGIRPGHPSRPNPGIGHRPHPGFNRHNHRGWIGRGHRGYAPSWWGAIIAGGYLAWHWFDTTPFGYWQCLAYNRYGNTFPGYGVDANQAASAAIDLCQRSSGYSEDSCFIPENYCRVR